MVVQLSILVGNVDDLLDLGFTHVEVWDSEDEGNSFQEITAETAVGPVLVSALPLNNFRLGGKLLRLVIDETAELSIPFSSVTELWTASQVANRINEVQAGLASVVGGKVQVAPPLAGRQYSIRVSYCDGIDLGWTAGMMVRGKDARIELQTGVFVYPYTDLAGRNSYRYKWRFSANGAPPVSEFSSVVYGKEPSSVASGNTSVATARFVGMDGKPLKHKLIISQVSLPQSVSGLFVSSPVPQVVESDDSGFLQLTLVRGTKVRAAIEGTSFVREFTVPNAASFNILQAMSDAPDGFGVQSPLPFLIRWAI